MKTSPLALGQDGNPRAFEVENVYVSPATVAQILRRTEGVTDVVQRRLFAAEREVHVKFKYQGYPCIVWEPYGDNSRYWIGPESTAAFEGNMVQVETAFANYQPPLHRSIIGDLLSLRFLRR